MGTWPGNPPEFKAQPEPNWRSMYEETKKALDGLRKAYDELERDYSNLMDDWMECGSGS